jgi:predicted secreted protein
MSDFHTLIDRLESIAADVDEIAFDRLREAVAEGSGERPPDDNKLMQVRRAIEKAATLLRQLDGSSSDDAWDGP